MADTTTNEIMLSMRGIHKSFGDLSVLRGIDLSLARGEVLAIIGSSGSGKSTLLRCINKLETIDRGCITIRGEKLCWTKNGESTATYASTADERRILMSTGMVFQQFNLFPHMTVIENLIEAPIHVKGQSRDEILPYARELLAKVGLSDRENYYPSQLSGRGTSYHACPRRRAHDHDRRHARNGICPRSGNQCHLYGQRCHRRAGRAADIFLRAERRTDTGVSAEYTLKFFARKEHLWKCSVPKKLDLKAQKRNFLCFFHL